MVCFFCKHKTGGVCVHQDQSKPECMYVLRGETFCQKKNCTSFHSMGYHTDVHGVPLDICSFGSTTCRVGKKPDCCNPKCQAGRSDCFERKCPNCRCCKIHLHTITSLIDLCYEFCKKHGLLGDRKSEIDDYDFM